jgi:phosphate transport system substrate-binding protein
VAGRERHGPGRWAATGLRIREGLCIGVVAALVGLAAACGTAAGTASVGRAAGVAAAVQPASGTTITETGSTLLYPLASTWAKAYQQQHQGVTVTTAATGSGAGIEDASDGAADIGTSDAYLSSGDLVKNPALLNIPLAISAQTVVYHVPGPPPGSQLDLDGAVLAGIYSGAITMWDNPAIKARSRPPRAPREPGPRW